MVSLTHLGNFVKQDFLILGRYVVEERFWLALGKQWDIKLAAIVPLVSCACYPTIIKRTSAGICL